MSDLLKIVERASESNILLVEDYLARNPVGDQGAPDQGAPPAAGGRDSRSSGALLPSA